jgi:hypothetical protein
MKKISILLLFITILSTGTFTSCTKEKNNTPEASSSPKADAIDPGEGPGNAVLTVTGSGLGQITRIVFDKGSVPVTFNPNFNTDKAIVFRVPDTANGGPQHIVFTNSIGKEFSVPFSVIALATISDVSNYNFTQGTEITITGNNLGDVSKVVLSGTNTEATIVSKSKKSLVISMPAATVNSAKLDITNASGTITTSQEFVNMDNAYAIFTEGYMNGFDNGSWGPAGIATDVAKSGSKSFKATYAKGNWWANGFANWWPGMSYSPEYKYLSFWVKGGSQTYTLYITGDSRAGGYGNSDQSAPITVPANVWTYFKIPLSSLDLWSKGPVFKQLGWWIKGPDPQDETFYFDDVILIK